MKKVLLATLFSVAALAGCSQKAEVLAQSQENANPICSTQNLTGGWSQSDQGDEADKALILHSHKVVHKIIAFLQTQLNIVKVDGPLGLNDRCRSHPRLHKPRSAISTLLPAGSRR